MLKPYRFRLINGVKHLVMTQAEWEKGYPNYNNVITDPNSPTGWPVGTKTALYYDRQHGTCLVPVIIEG